MKKELLLAAMLVWAVTVPLFAQNSLIGTWVAKTDSVEEIKIFTPTHFMFVIRSLHADTVVNGGGGTYAIKGDKLIENLQTPDFTDFYVNQEPYKKLKAEYNFKVEGDKFYQKGDLIISDTRKVPINHTFVKVKNAKSFPNNPAIGTWNQLSSTYWGPDGKKESHTNATATRFQIITPTHWMRTSTRNKKLENRMGGSYTMVGNKVYPTLEYASFKVNKGDKVEVIQRVEGDKMYWSGTIKDATGKTNFNFEDVFQRVNNKGTKIASVK